MLKWCLQGVPPLVIYGILDMAATPVMVERHSTLLFLGKSERTLDDCIYSSSSKKQLGQWLASSLIRK